MKQIVGERYDTFNNKRKQLEAQKADEDELLELKEIEKKVVGVQRR